MFRKLAYGKMTINVEIKDAASVILIRNKKSIKVDKGKSYWFTGVILC